MTAFESLSARSKAAPESGIMQVIEYGLGRPGLIPLWAGEGHRPTPEFICSAANASLAAGETFYTYQGGIPALRESLAAYHSFHYGGSFDPARFFVTASGMHAMQTAVLMVADPGDEIIFHEPAWPNFAAAADIAGVRPVPVAMQLTEPDDGPSRWTLDPQALFDAVTPRTRGFFLNTPSNPTGWVMPADDMKRVLDFARERGLWIIADEIYGRFCFGGGQPSAQDRLIAPSFYAFIEPEDRVLFVNTFSKNWAMTGWRIGWLGAPQSCWAKIENLVQYSTSGVAVFMQRAAVAALDDGDAFSEAVIEDARTGRTMLADALGKSSRFRFADPDGAFYGFFAIDGHSDTDQLGMTLVDQANIGLAPGSAFGDSGRGYVRLCFARDPDSLGEALGRLNEWVAQKTPVSA
ncbi:MAG: pyridoxal phosphate-dependent aminotransferase [Pseudomonadota bacterium]